MYLFVYKTTHTNGRYYIGRHSTDNLNDGYIGSGNWVSGIKDKSTLTREIIVEATDFAELCQLEEYHISLHYDDPLCMNSTKSSIGLSSEEATAINNKRVQDGTHPFLGGDVSRTNNNKRVEDGTHPFLGGDISRATTKKRIEDGTHHFLGGKIQKESNRKRLEDGTHHLLGGKQQKESAKKLVENGTHHFLGGELNRKRVENGTFHFLGGHIQRESARKHLEAGTHHSQQKWTCPHCGKAGQGKSNFTRYHGDNCKMISSPAQET
jgi:hypothetical protein